MASKTLGDAVIVAVSSDRPAESRKLVAGVQAVYGITVTVPLLSDPDVRVIGRYGLVNMHTAPGPKGRLYATPGTFILDRAGVVRWRMVDENWKLRPTNPLIMAALDAVRRGEDASRFTLASVAVAEPDTLPVGAAAGASAPEEGMVRIPAGTFVMGDRGRTTGDSPGHDVTLEAFDIDAREVTTRQYRRFLEAASRDHRYCHPLEPPGKDHTPKYWADPDYTRDALPVVGVDWFDAYAYAAWAGKALPTEAQWERAARGGLESAAFPWGDGENSERVANTNLEAGERAVDLPEADHGHAPKPVGSFAPNGFGVYDATGNVEEWCRDWYDESYYRRSPSSEPAGPRGGVLKVVRGASWHHGTGRVATRYTHAPDERAVFLGFRCVRTLASVTAAEGRATR